MDQAVIIVCAKDIGAESVTRPIAEKALHDGHDVGIIVEGLAGPRFIKAGLIPEFMGTVNFKEWPFTFGVKTYLDKRFRDNDGTERPGVLMIGESHPVNLEWQLGFAVSQINAQRTKKIKIIECQDFWGNNITLLDTTIKPDRVLTLDEFAKQLTLKIHSHLRDEDVIIVGNPGVKRVAVSEKTQQLYQKLKTHHERVFFFAGGGQGHTEAELEFLKQCLALTPDSWILVLGYHPKAVKIHGDAWRAIVAPLGNRVIEATPGTGDEWATLADMTLSGMSTTMTTAVYAGNTATVLWTKEVEETLKKQNIDRTPLAALGCAHCIEKPTDLSQLGRSNAENLKKLRPYDPDAAWKAVEELLGT